MRPVPGFLLLAASALAALLSIAAPNAHAQTFGNGSPITVPTSSTDGRASLYPSSIVVAGAPTSLSYVSVTLSGFSHTFARDVRALLVSPTGQGILLMARCNGSGDANNNSLTFVPDSPATLPVTAANVVSGVYACSVYDGVQSSSLPAPAPAAPYGTSLAPLIGTNANGTWNLYVWDDFPSQDDGSFAGGWSISFNRTVGLPTPTAFTYQGLLASGGTPINGDANVRFTLCNNATVATSISAVAPPITRSFTGIANGLISTSLDFRSVIDTPQQLWLNIEVESPPGSGFVTLSPRQPVTAAPQARVAQFAANASRAVNADVAAQLGPGRATIRGDAANTPGIWFASPIDSPVNRGFVGMRDDTSLGLFNNSWNLLLHGNGNLALGDPGGTAPPERLTVNGNIQLNTGATIGRFVFGTLAGTGENTDPVLIQRVNLLSDVTELRITIGDNPGAFSAATSDYLVINTTDGTQRFVFRSDGTAFRPGGGSWAALSDASTKDNLTPLTGTLDRLLSLHGYSFTYKPEFVADGRGAPGPQIGLVAQDVQRVFPEWVTGTADGKLCVTERATTALMVEALRDLRAEKDRQIEALKADAARRDVEAARRDAENAELKARLERLERLLSGGSTPTKP